MTEEQLKALERLGAEATPGPLHVETDRKLPGKAWVECTLNQGLWSDEGYATTEDARFIAAACNAVPRLIAEVRRLRGMVGK